MYKIFPVLISTGIFFPVILFTGTSGEQKGVVPGKKAGETLPCINATSDGVLVCTANNCHGTYSLTLIPLNKQSLKSRFIDYQPAIAEKHLFIVEYTSLKLPTDIKAIQFFSIIPFSEIHEQHTYGYPAVKKFLFQLTNFIT